jgi:hypothetical protein
MISFAWPNASLPATLSIAGIAALVSFAPLVAAQQDAGAPRVRLVPGLDGRSLVAHLWSGRAAEPVRFRNVLLAGVPVTEVDAALRDFARWLQLGSEHPIGRILDQPLITESRLQRGRGARGIVFIAGGDMPAWSLAELASTLGQRGIPSVVLPGDPTQVGSPDSAGVQRTLRHLTAMWPVMRSWDEMRARPIVIAAWGRGALPAAIAATTLAGVDGLVSLDGALGYAYGDSLLERVAAGRSLGGVPYLQIEAGVRGSVARSSRVLNAWCGAERWLLVAAGLAHRHFITPWSLGAIADGDANVRLGLQRVSAVLEWFARKPSARPDPLPAGLMSLARQSCQS